MGCGNVRGESWFLVMSSGEGVGGVFSGVRDRGIRAGLAERPPGGERR